MTPFDKGALAAAMRGLAGLAAFAGLAGSCERADDPITEELVFETRVKPSGDAVDLLFVVDNSPVTHGIRQVLAERGAILLRALLASEPEAQRVADLHVGVISTDIGDGGYGVWSCERPDMGALFGGPSNYSGICERVGVVSPPFLEADELEPNDGSPGDPNGVALGDEFSCLASLEEVGAPEGCGLEQPLGALRLALTDRVVDGTNAGFLRPDAVLAVVIVSEEDDCTATEPSFFDPGRQDLAPIDVRCAVHPDELEPVEGFVALLRSQRPAGRVLAGGWISVPPDWDGGLEELRRWEDLDWRTATPEDFVLCTCADGNALVAPRLAELVVLMGGDGFAWSQCEIDLLEELQGLAEQILGRLEPQACLPAAPPAASRCEASVRPIDPGAGCPPATREAETGVCLLEAGQWRLVETAACTELRADLEVPSAASLELRCFAPRDG